MRVLVADDELEMAVVLQALLEREHFSVDTVYSGPDALAYGLAENYDCLVLDIMMPRMNGYELCKNIKEDIAISHIPVILLTARDDKQSQMSGYKNGADAYLTKPFEVEMLMELIRNRLKNREHTKKRYLNAGLIPAPEESIA